MPRNERDSTQAAPTLDLTVEGMAYGGKGVARVDGKVYFVADAVPGDVVRARIVSNAERYAEAETAALVTPSPLRSPPLCRYAEACGGCQWMGVDYARQLEWKLSFVASSLKRIGKLTEATPMEILPSPALYGYRNRVLMRAHLSDLGQLKMGYFERGTRDLVSVHRCEIAAEPINDLVQSLLSGDWQGLQALKARVEMQEVPAVGGKDLLVTVYPAEGPREAMDAFVARIRAVPRVLWAGLVFDLSEAPVVAFDEDLGQRFQTIPGQFQQVNVAHNRALRRLVKAKVDETNPARVLDVCCGSGNLSLPLADGVRYIEGIESNKKAIFVAKQNAALAGLTNVRYLAGDAEAHLWKCDRGHEKFDLILLDPPRTGMYKGMVPLKNIDPDYIIYVSCDPATLARDLGYLCRKDAYTIERVTALDFFPNTYHVETVAFLRRSR